MSQTEARHPDHSFSYGRVQVGIWKTEVVKDDQTMVEWSTKIQKRFENKEKTWQSTPYFSHSELADLEAAAREARQFIRRRTHERFEDNAESEPVAN
ncbi:MAG: hypothetical protein IID42_00155 [Planctomycetes bacterium]|nr:hypothetical protein [Planctomycetota bacterium]